MKLSDFKEIIKQLSHKRKIFHSEDDFKFSLAMEIKNQYSDYQIFLERPVVGLFVEAKNLKNEPRASIDIILKTNENELIPIELKYKTKKVSLNFDKEEYDLADHGATDIGRYSFRKDIYRVEKFIELKEIKKIAKRGYVLILTNDESYLEDISKTDKIDKNYSFHPHCEIPKSDIGWNYNNNILNKYNYDSNKNLVSKKNNKSHWTSSNKLSVKLNLNYDYKVEWNEYSSLEYSSSKKTKFQFCLIEIELKSK